MASWCVATVARAESVYLAWESPAGAVSYELQTATDPGFTQGLKSQMLRTSQQLIEFANATPARIRAIFPNRRATQWKTLTWRNWNPPRLPLTIGVRRSEVGEKRATWARVSSAQAPVSALELVYRIRLSVEGTGVVLQEAVVRSAHGEESFLIPELPGGDYILSVETWGDPAVGTLHPVGQGVAQARIVMEALPKQPPPPRLAELSDPFVPGIVLGLEPSLTQRPLEAGNLISTEVQLRLGAEQGFYLAAEMPVVVSDAETGAEAPRLGGDPFPNLQLGYRLLGRAERYLGLGAMLTTTTDTSRQSQFASNVLLGVAAGRWSEGRNLVFEGNAGYGSSLGRKGETSISGISTQFIARSFSYAFANVTPFYIVHPRVWAGLTLGWSHSGQVTINLIGRDWPGVPAVHRGRVGPAVRVQLLDSVLLNASGLWGIGPSDRLDAAMQLALGLSWVL